MRARARLLTACSLLAIGTALAVAGVSSGVRSYQLPDLRQVVPLDVGLVVTGGANPRERLIFSSTINNLGPGPFVIEGRRASLRTPYMTGAQLVFARDGAYQRVPNIGRLRYIRAPDHAHWHLLRLEIYELRDAGTGALVAPDRKTGFCPGDRFMNQRLPRGWSGRAGKLRNDNNCGKTKTKALSVLESISPGWADVYHGNLEGQFIDITGVPAGRYVLVNRVNPDLRLREVRYDNNISSALIELNRPAGAPPTVTKIDGCQDQEPCPWPTGPPLASR
jgi:hypothetical protein